LEDRLAYNRDFEREADALGIKTMNNAGFDPHGMVQFFGRMERWARVQEMDVPEFLRTHPLTTARIAEAENRSARFPRQSQQKNPHYQVIRARLRARYDSDPKDVLVLFDQLSLENPTGIDNAIARYGHALAQLRLRETDAAIATLSDIRQKHPVFSAFSFALADALATKGDYDAALAILDNESLDHGVTDSGQFAGQDNSLKAIRLLKTVDLLLRAGRSQQAFEITNSMVRTYRDSASLPIKRWLSITFSMASIVPRLISYFRLNAPSKTTFMPNPESMLELRSFKTKYRCSNLNDVPESVVGPQCPLFNNSVFRPS
jgi:predicted Zn-dependent protease